MISYRSRLTLAASIMFVLMCLATMPSLAQEKDAAPDPYKAVLNNLSWRSIGPATMGGRIDQLQLPMMTSRNRSPRCRHC